MLMQQREMGETERERKRVEPTDEDILHMGSERRQFFPFFPFKL